MLKLYQKPLLLLSSEVTASKNCVLKMQVDRMNCLVSELADVVIEGRAMFDEYESMLISIAELQVRTRTMIKGSKCSC